MTTPRPRPTEPTPVEPIRPDAIRPEVQENPTKAPPEFSVLSLVNTALRNRWLILALALLGGFYAGYTALQLPKLFTTQAQFMPKGARGQSQFQGIAQQFGIAMGDADPSQSAQFYTDLFDSRPLLQAVADREYRVRTDSGVVTGTLAQIYHIRDRNPEVVKTSVAKTLHGQLKASPSFRTGVITLTVKSKYPELSVQIARNLLDQVNLFNLNRRQEQAGAERTFIEKQMGDALGELSRAEDNLQAFLTENRDFKQSPNLALEFDRLNRAVTFRQQMYNTLAVGYEQAKIEEVRNLPVITVLEPPEMPIQAESRRGKRKVVLGMLAGAFLGLILAFFRDRFVASHDPTSDEFAEFTGLRRDALSELTHPLRGVSTLFTRRRS